MDMIFQNNNLYIDLEGEVDDKVLLKKLEVIKDNYDIESIVINKDNAFNYSNYKVNKYKKMFRSVTIK